MNVADFAARVAVDRLLNIIDNVDGLHKESCGRFSWGVRRCAVEWVVVVADSDQRVVEGGGRSSGRARLTMCVADTTITNVNGQTGYGK